MKKVQNVKILLLILLIAVMFSVVVYAFSEGAGRSIDESESNRNNSYLMYKTIAKQRLDKKNKEAAESFKIDLNSYTEIGRDNPAFKKDLLFLLCPQVEATRGDSTPTIFLDGTNNSGIVLKQDKNGVNYKYSFVKQGDRWEVINKEVSQ